MKNITVLAGRLPGFDGKYTAANGDKKSRMNWAMNVQLNSKNDQGYYDEALVNFTAWGYFADQLQQVNLMDKEAKKEFANIEVSGKLVPGYKDKDGNIQSSINIDVAEFTFTRRLPQANNNAGANEGNVANASKGPGAKAPGAKAPGAKAPTPGAKAPARPGIPGGARQPKF